MSNPVDLTLETLITDLAAIVGSVKASDIASIVSAFATHNIVGEIEGVSTLAEAIIKVVAIALPGAAIGELAVEVLAFVAIAIVELPNSPFNVFIHGNPPPPDPDPTPYNWPE